MERKYPSGRSWTAWDHNNTTHTKLSEHEWRSFNPQHKNTTQENPAPSSSLGGNKARMRTETFNGAIVSGTWPHPDAYYTTKPLEVCQPHLYTHTHTDTCAHKPTVASNTGATRVLSSTLSVLLSGRFLKFGRLEKPTDGVMSYHNVAAHTLRNTRHEYACISTNRHTHSDPHQQKCDSRVPPGDEDGEWMGDPRQRALLPSSGALHHRPVVTALLCDLFCCSFVLFPLLSALLATWLVPYLSHNHPEE